MRAPVKEEKDIHSCFDCETIQRYYLSAIGPPDRMPFAKSFLKINNSPLSAEGARDCAVQKVAAAIGTGRSSKLGADALMGRGMRGLSHRHGITARLSIHHGIGRNDGAVECIPICGGEILCTLDRVVVQELV